MDKNSYKERQFVASDILHSLMPQTFTERFLCQALRTHREKQAGSLPQRSFRSYKWVTRRSLLGCSYTVLRQIIPKGADADTTVEDVIWGRDSGMDR